MTNTLKVVIGVAAALVVGFLVGFIAGSSGKGDLANTAKRERNRAESAESSRRQLEKRCDRKTKKCRTSRQLMLAKERLLRATIEMYANNYGLTSQHLGIARKHLKSATKGLKKKHAKVAQDLYDQMGGAQTLAMRLDPMARVQIEQILAAMQRLPGVR